MNIAIISDYNIGGQPTSLWRAINKYTKHKARCIVAQDDHFQYDKDIILNTKEEKEEAAEFCKTADFFHFGRSIFNWPGIDFNQLLNKSNCCIKYYGSELRQNWPTIKKFHEQTGLAAITGTDWTITGHLLNSFYHLGSYFTKYGDMAPADIPRCKQDGGLKICAGSAGSPLKGYDVFDVAVRDLQTEGYDVGLNFISQVSNKVCLERKLEYNCTFTSLHGGWGISGIESMFQGHVILSCLDPWVMSLYPSNPTVIIDKNNIKQAIKWLAENHDMLGYLYGDWSRQFAIDNFSTKTILKRYLYLIDLIMHSDEYQQGGHAPKEIYQF